MHFALPEVPLDAPVSCFCVCFAAFVVVNYNADDDDDDDDDCDIYLGLYRILATALANLESDQFFWKSGQVRLQPNF